MTGKHQRWRRIIRKGPEREAAPRSEGPAPSVARISLIHGDVSTQRGDSGDWGSTSINAPVVRGDQVATGQDARAEIQLDYANILRLAAHSQAKIADLTPKRIQVQVGQGYASYTMLKGSEADVEIDSPNVAVRPLQAGTLPRAGDFRRADRCDRAGRRSGNYHAAGQHSGACRRDY